MFKRGELTGTDAAILFGVWATFALDVFSTLNSSPQTTELFAKDREESLMHWVLVGDATAVAGGAAWSLMSRNPVPLLATVLVVGGMHLAYTHAVTRGKTQAPPANAAASSSSSSTSTPAGWLTP